MTPRNNPVPVSENWRIAHLEDITKGNSKTFIVPAKTEWQLLSIYVAYHPTVGAGNRQLEILMLDDQSNVIGAFQVGAVGPAGVDYNYLIAGGAPDMSSPRDSAYLMTPLPNLLFLAGQKLCVHDNNNVDSDDDMFVYIQYACRTV